MCLRSHSLRGRQDLRLLCHTLRPHRYHLVGLCTNTETRTFSSPLGHQRKGARGPEPHEDPQNQTRVCQMKSLLPSMSCHLKGSHTGSKGRRGSQPPGSCLRHEPFLGPLLTVGPGSK